MLRRIGILATVGVGLAIFAPGGLTTPVELSGQLLSPGRLAAAHAELEGIRNCTQCHELGQRGISSSRCLDCHVPLASRIAAGSGYHATVEPDSCADCHQDHLGADFDLLHFDPDDFDHADTGYELQASHALVDCRDCHVVANIADPEVVEFKSEHAALDRTYLGLGATCAQCHQAEDPHGAQFENRECSDCHDEGDWNDPPSFDHELTSFPLDGEHVSVGCADCHGSDPANAVYRPLPFESCSDCHEDPHDGSMNDACTSCHQTAGWLAVSAADVERSFDHESTRFPLLGAHDVADCSACHQTGGPPNTALLHMTYVAGTERSTFPQPRFENCFACHVDQHPDPSGERWTDCASCHTEVRFAPSPFDLARHAETIFPLDGAHVVTPCVGCHQSSTLGHTAFTLSIPDQACVDCHEADDPHEGAYVDFACGDCHVTEGFDLAGFDHDRVAGGPDAQSCASCHAPDDPHAGQFAGQDCASCHATTAFTIPDFDHSTTSFALDGAHSDATCASCHIPENDTGIVRYTPLGSECADCHGGNG